MFAPTELCSSLGLRRAKRYLPFATLTLWASLPALVGCVGTVGAPQAEGSGSDRGNVDSNGGAGKEGDATPPEVIGPPGPRPLRRLSRTELENTFADLLGVAADVPPELSDVLANSGYLEGGSVSKVEAESMLDWTGRLATAAAAKMSTLYGCPASPATRVQEDDCARAFIQTFGRRAFRRPLSQVESDDLLAYYSGPLRKTLAYDHPAAMRGLLWLMLQSPRFLYHWERPPEAATVKDDRIALGPHEVAARLSYLFWGSMPDDALADAADRGELSRPDQIQAQARRLLANERGERMIESFVLQWFGIGDIAKMTKAAKYNFTPELGKAMLDESHSFIRSVFEQDGTLETLLTSPVTTITDSKLAQVYGYTGPIGSTMTVKLDPTQRAGFLTSASFLTAQALNSDLNPIKRGLAVVSHLLCLVIPSPPNNVPPAKLAGPELSTRKRLTEHGENACARGCHGVFDPPGMAFEHYDGIGAYRTMDGGEAVDSSATIVFPSGESKSVKDAVELSGILAESSDVRACLARQWMRYALRRPEVDADDWSLTAAGKSIDKPHTDLRALMVAMTTTPAFLFRSPSVGEVMQPQGGL